MYLSDSKYKKSIDKNNGMMSPEKKMIMEIKYFFELGPISRSVIGCVVVILTLISVVIKIRDMAFDMRHKNVEIYLM